MKTRTFKIGTALFLAFVSMAGTATASADDGYLVINTLALHFENADERNTLTPGVGWEYSPASKVGFHLGTLSDSFGYQSFYGGVNFATKPQLAGRVRFLIGATFLHKQYKKNGEPETRLVPLPAMEFKLTNRSVLNLSGSPAVDFGNHRNNGVLFFQFKLQLK